MSGYDCHERYVTRSLAYAGGLVDLVAANKSRQGLLVACDDSIVFSLQFLNPPLPIVQIAAFGQQGAFMGFIRSFGGIIQSRVRIFAGVATTFYITEIFGSDAYPWSRCVCHCGAKYTYTQRQFPIAAADGMVKIIDGNPMRVSFIINSPNAGSMNLYYGGGGGGAGMFAVAGGGGPHLFECCDYPGIASGEIHALSNVGAVTTLYIIENSIVL